MTGRSDALPLPFLDVRKQPRNSLAAGETDALGKLFLTHQQVNGRSAKPGQVADFPPADEPGWHVASEVTFGGSIETAGVAGVAGFHSQTS